jgi:hypothetical protein
VEKFVESRKNKPKITSPSHPRRIKVAERRAYVVAMRVAGAQLQQCADAAIQKFGAENLPKNYGATQVWTDIARAQERVYSNIRDDLTIFRMIQMDRYEGVIRFLWPKALRGEMGAMDKLLKAMKDESKLLGLEAPQQVDMRVMQIDARIERLMEAVASRRQDQTARALGDGGAEMEDAIVDVSARRL